MLQTSFMRRTRTRSDRALGHAPRRWFLAVLVIATLAGFGLPTQPARAAQLPDLQCGVNPTTDVRLRADLTCDGGFRPSSSGADAQRVNIDLGGHTLTVINGTCTSFFACGAVYNEASVTNGTVVGDLKDVQRISQVEVIGNVYLNESGSVSEPTLLTRSKIRDGRVVIFGPNVTIRQNMLIGGGALGGGIQFLDHNNLSNSQVIDNRIQDTPGDGMSVVAGEGCFGCFDDISGRIADNTIVRSGGDGIRVGGTLWAFGRLDVEGNTVRDSVGDGISVAAALPDVPTRGSVVLASNRVLRNGGHGINATWVFDDPTIGVIDGGGNVARLNALSPQCIGVVCLPHGDGHQGD